MMIDAVRLCAAAALSVLPRRPDQPASQPARRLLYSGSRTYQTQYCTTPLPIGRASPAPAAAAAAAAAAIATAADRLVSGVGIVRPGSDTRATFHWISSVVAASGAHAKLFLSSSSLNLPVNRGVNLDPWDRGTPAATEISPSFAVSSVMLWHRRPGHVRRRRQHSERGGTDVN